MLARAGFRDDPLLAHPPRQQRLAERIVDLVRAGVQQVFALQINLRAAAMPRQPLREIKFGRPAGELLQVMPQLLLKRRIFARHLVRGAEFLQRRHQRLGHEHAAVAAEMAARIGQGEAIEFFGVGWMRAWRSPRTL